MNVGDDSAEAGRGGRPRHVLTRNTKTPIRGALTSRVNDRFVDPRSNPEPPPQVSREPAAAATSCGSLVSLCWVGRVCEVERWIRSGRPIQAATYKSLEKPAMVVSLRMPFDLRCL